MFEDALSSGAIHVLTCVMHGLGEGTTTPISTEAATATSVIARGATIKASSPVQTIVMVSINKAVVTTTIPSRRIFHRKQKAHLSKQLARSAPECRHLRKGSQKPSPQNQ